jgi:hypothetical protein
MSKQCTICSREAEDDARSCIACGGTFASAELPLYQRPVRYAFNHPVRALLTAVAVAAFRMFRRSRR